MLEDVSGFETVDGGVVAAGVAWERVESMFGSTAKEAALFLFGQ